MDWKNFLEALCKSKDYQLTAHEVEVLMCLDETQRQTKKDLLETYNRSYPAIEDEAFTQRLKNIYKKFEITGRGYKLPQLQKLLAEKYLQYQNKDIFFSEVGLSYIYTSFPKDRFGQEIDNVIRTNNPAMKQVDILQTFAPNLNDYTEHFIQCIQHNIQVRILLAWPYSEAAKLRECVLKRYADRSLSDEINICDFVIANLETLEKIIGASSNSHLIDVRLYDTLPSLAIYRAGDYLLAAPFLHGSLAIHTFQLELRLNASNQFIAQTLRKDFELMWQVARSFYPDPGRNWRNDLKILFTN
jgi:hypothetical protein